MHALSGAKEFGALFLRRWRNAFSTILFYIVQFLLVVWIFGTSYAMVVSCSTTMFQLRRKEPNRMEDYVATCAMSLLLCLLAFAAGLNVWLCAALNFAVPFFLVLWRCSQFTPKGHLGYAMTFVFLELRPPPWNSSPPSWRQWPFAAFCWWRPSSSTPEYSTFPPIPRSKSPGAFCVWPSCWTTWPPGETPGPPGGSSTS